MWSTHLAFEFMTGSCLEIWSDIVEVNAGQEVIAHVHHLTVHHIILMVELCTLLVFVNTYR